MKKIQNIKKQIAVAFIAAVMFVTCFGFVGPKAVMSDTVPCAEANVNMSTNGWTLVAVNSYCYQGGLTVMQGSPPEPFTWPWCCVESQWWYVNNEGEYSMRKNFRHSLVGICVPPVQTGHWAGIEGLGYQYYTCLAWSSYDPGGSGGIIKPEPKKESN